ncbi:hypothetical protein INT47_012432 [Mucor saturninus]|uniref:Uncharacterized protein n=1 Tax=Mucor saturninus TaxID=64648 RepID=A0A8H7UVH3_9FUNG|nr:hypothetical protein INT47_012432 [Mucor saturninus]
MIIITGVYAHPNMNRTEANYNYRVIWPFMDVVAECLPTCQFEPGEKRLQAISEELKRQDLATSHFYNADGVIFDDELGLELALLETSGPFSLDDPTRETNDHVKAAYGLLVMLHTIAYKYVYADADIFMRLKVYFVHPTKNRIRVWTFGLVDKELYVLNRIKSATRSKESVFSFWLA